MNQPLTQWLDSCARTPGVLGCGVRQPDGTRTTVSHNESCSREMVDEILKYLADSMPAFSSRGFIPNRLQWVFERGELLLVPRTDGLLLGLVLQPGSPAAQNPEVLTAEFLALELNR